MLGLGAATLRVSEAQREYGRLAICVYFSPLVFSPQSCPFLETVANSAVQFPQDRYLSQAVPSQTVNSKSAMGNLSFGFLLPHSCPLHGSLFYSVYLWTVHLALCCIYPPGSNSSFCCSLHTTFNVHVPRVLSLPTFKIFFVLFRAFWI